MKVIGFVLVFGSVLWTLERAPAAQITLRPAWIAEGNQAGAGFGSGVSDAGDVDGDGYDDVLVTAYRADGELIDEGRVYLFRGSADGLAKLPSWSVESDQASATLGPAAAAGDVNGDGFDDVVVGSYLHSNDQYLEGRAELYLGSSTGLGATPAWTEGGGLGSELFGWITAAGDLDGDGYDDVIIGAPGFRNGQSSEGRACAYFGSPTGLVTYAGWCFEGNQRNAALGFPVSPAGDVNGDGFADVLVGAYQFNGDLPNEGRAFLFQGSDRRRLR